MHLFEDMLGTIEESMFTPVPVLAEEKPQATSARNPAKKKTDGKKKAPIEKKTATEKQVSGEKKAQEPPSDKRISGGKVATARQPERSAAKRKATAITGEKTNSKSTPERRSPLQLLSNVQQQQYRREKENQAENQEPSRSTKRQKREVPQQPTAAAPTSGKSRSGKEKKKTSPPKELPLFRHLELDDGTVVDFSAQREEARTEREAMQSFLDKCTLIWKKQLSAISVQ